MRIISEGEETVIFIHITLKKPFINVQSLDLNTVFGMNWNKAAAKRAYHYQGLYYSVSCAVRCVLFARNIEAVLQRDVKV